MNKHPPPALHMTPEWDLQQYQAYAKSLEEDVDRLKAQWQGANRINNQVVNQLVKIEAVLQTLVDLLREKRD